MRVPKPNDLLRLLRNSGNRPMRFKEISARLGISEEAKHVIKKILKEMVSNGKLRKVQGGKYATSEYKNKKKSDVAFPSKPIVGLMKGDRILGKYIKTGKTGKLVPKDEKLPSLELLPDEIKNLRNNSIIVAELGKKLSKTRQLQGSVVDILGKVGDMEAEKRALLVEYDLPSTFSPKSMRELEEVLGEISQSEIERRVDLRKETIFTIDNENAKDFDDAVGIKKTKNGYKLYVSIADVSYYVILGSELDNEAFNRATSVYLADSVVPMLPERLSNDLCSLVPYKDRLTKTVEINFNLKGEMLRSKIYDSVIRSSARTTYKYVADTLEKRGRVSDAEKQIITKLKLMRELFKKVRSRRVEAGELFFDIPEPELVRNERGKIVDVVKAERNLAHEMIEEFMIAANTAVANFVFSSNASSLYRIHEPPDREVLVELSEALRKLGYTMSVNGSASAFEIQEVVEKSKNKPNKVAVNMLILRSLNKAVYSTLRHGHFGLGLEHYTHFTSPIRRYPDLIVHRIVNSLLERKSLPYKKDSLDWIAEHSSKKERIATTIERESINLETAYLMKSHVNKEFEGTVISVLPFGIFVEIEDIYVEGLIPRESVKDWRKRWFNVGQRVRVKVVNSDIEKRRITLNLAR